MIDWRKSLLFIDENRFYESPKVSIVMHYGVPNRIPDSDTSMDSVGGRVYFIENHDRMLSLHADAAATFSVVTDNFALLCQSLQTLMDYGFIEIVKISNKPHDRIKITKEGIDALLKIQQHEDSKRISQQMEANSRRSVIIASLALVAATCIAISSLGNLLLNWKQSDQITNSYSDNKSTKEQLNKLGKIDSPAIISEVVSAKSSENNTVEHQARDLNNEKESKK